MARSSFGPRRATTWATEQHPRPVPRIVRLGRPANDNDRGFGPLVKALAAFVVAAIAVVAALNWRVF
jgi:hypothetical protein